MPWTPRKTLFTNGTIWSGVHNEHATELLIENGKVVSLGASAPTGEADEVVDLEGGFLMPSFGEGHAHPIFGGLEEKGPAIRSCSSVEEIVEAVRRYADERPEKEWILGASYDGSLVERGLFEARWLDEAVSDRPVVLRAWDYHTLWCNSKAFEMAGIHAGTPEPDLGEIPRDADGGPLGVLREWGAVDLMNAVNPGNDFEDRVAALHAASTKFASLGVTWVQDAWVEPDDLDVYIAASQRGLLVTRVNLALLADPRSFPESLPQLLVQRERIEALKDPWLTANSVKFFADGVIENETGRLSEPYCTALHDHGMFVWDPKHLAEAVAMVDDAGFQPHIHAIGDEAVKIALDAIEHAAEANGQSKNRPVIAHVQLASDRDLQRFAQLGVIPMMQPLWAQLDPLMTVLTVPRLGEKRAQRQYKMRTLEKTGADLAFGSDWPCSSADPLEGISVAVTRQTDEGYPSEGWVPDERIDLMSALSAYTQGVARQAGADLLAEPWGRLMPGASADMVWFDKDPREIPPAQLKDLKINATYLAGSPIFLRGHEEKRGK